MRAKQCIGYTKKGRRCRRRTLSSTGLCGRCAGYRPAPPDSASSVTGEHPPVTFSDMAEPNEMVVGQEDILDGPLSDGGWLTMHAVLCGTPLGRQRSADEIIENLIHLSGAPGDTQSPFMLGGVVERPEEGFAVALRGSDHHPSDVLLVPPSRASSLLELDEINQTRRTFRTWYRSLLPLLASGRVWVGFWKDTTEDGWDMTVEVTVVVKPDQEAFARRLAENQDQKAIYDIGAQRVIEIGGTGGPQWSPASLAANIQLPENGV